MEIFAVGWREAPVALLGMPMHYSPNEDRVAQLIQEMEDMNLPDELDEIILEVDYELEAKFESILGEVNRLVKEDIIFIMKDEHWEYKVGSTIVFTAGAPGIGHVVHRVTHKVGQDLYGVIIENIMRILDPSEVV